MTPEEQEQQELLQSFVEEGRELIDDAEPLIIELESQATADDSGEIDSETINTIFRLFHSLKGGAGFLDLKLVSRVTHEAETLLDIFRKGEGKLTAAHVDLINRASDFLRKLLDQIATEWNEDGHDEEAEKVASELRGAIAAIRDGGDSEPPVAEVVEAVETVDEETVEIEAENPASNPATIEDEESTPAAPEADATLPDLIPLTPEILSQFVTESEELLAEAEDALMRFERDREDEAALQEAFRALHSFKGNCGFVDFKDMMVLSNGAENILDLYRTKNVEYNPQTVSMLLEIIDFLSNTLKSVTSTGDGSIPAASGLLHLLEDTVGEQIIQQEKNDNAASTADETKTELPESQVQVAENAPAAKKTLASEADNKPAAVSTAKKFKTNGASSAPKAPSQQTRQPMQQRQSVRVDVEKVDQLLDLVGELVIAESMVAQNPDLRDVDIPLERFERAAVQLNKITRDLQDISTSIRMIPLAGTFRRLHRLVRDVAQKSNKMVELEIEGEDTEVDKTVIENITDPLVHILRNSIDHGIEAPEVRAKIGKESTGKVEVKAFYVGGEVWITITDDGSGLSREKLVKKAVERELVTLEEAELMSDEDVWQFIFQPGFSTAEKVTSVSGRGVGMDVVRRNIEQIRGRVEVRSETGVGSTVTLRIPLTLAIIDSMLLRVGEEKYVIPITAIRESLQVTSDMITRPMEGREIIRVRDELFPVLRLHELFDIDADAKNLEDGIVSILEVDGNSFGLFVDELLGQSQIVIKGLSEYISDQPCVSGCTILGDGSICLILDLAGIVKRINQISEQSCA